MLKISGHVFYIEKGLLNRKLCDMRFNPFDVQHHLTF